jgi:bis(5'-nucleosyl)-tetraphosphatase (symmetrical)
MSTYVIGDIHGCYVSLRALLKKIHFNSLHDRLWLTGDLINRGGRSAETLEYLYTIRHCVTMVLGNHDLFLIAAYHKIITLNNNQDLESVLQHKKAKAMISWLEQQPLVYKEHNHILVHAGIPGSWSTAQALNFNQEFQSHIQSHRKIHFLRNMYGNSPQHLESATSHEEHLRCIINHFTRMRFIDSTSKGIELKNSCHPDDAPDTLTPWFRHPSNRTETILFGHWSALAGEYINDQHIALDTGCVWGGKLTAYELHTRRFFHVEKN